MSNENVKRHLLELYKIGFLIIPEEDIRKKIPNLLHTKTIYED